MRKTINDHFIKSETVNSIGQFTLLWGMMEEKYFEKECMAKRIINLRLERVPKAAVPAAIQIKNELEKYYGSTETIIERLNFRDKDKLLREPVTRFLINDGVDENTIIKAAICICFRIRNNMFHGEKIFWIINQQVIIFDACADFMNELIEYDDASFSLV